MHRLRASVAPSLLARRPSVITVRHRMPDGSIVDLGPDNYVSFFNESPMPAGVLISEDGSQRDPYDVDGTTGRASFAADIDDAIPDSFRVSISVSANEGTGRGSIRVLRQLAEDHAPVIDRFSTSTGDTLFASGSMVRLVGEFHDHDGDVISAVWSGPGIGGGPAASTTAPAQVSAVSKVRTATFSTALATVTLGLPGRIRRDVKGAIQREYRDAAYRSCPDFPEDSLQYLWREAHKRYNCGAKYDYLKWVPDNPKDESSAGHWERIQHPEFKPNSDPQDPQPNPPPASGLYADEVWETIVNHPKDRDVP